MRKLGIVIFVIGLLFTVFTGFKVFTKEEVLDVGKLEITRDKEHDIAWSPYLGVAVMVIGGIIFFLEKKK